VAWNLLLDSCWLSGCAEVLDHAFGMLSFGDVGWCDHHLLHADRHRKDQPAAHFSSIPATTRCSIKHCPYSGLLVSSYSYPGLELQQFFLDSSSFFLDYRPKFLVVSVQVILNDEAVIEICARMLVEICGFRCVLIGNRFGFGFDSHWYFLYSVSKENMNLIHFFGG
jgi:hypothetical protein